jgi:hypothetical protein
MTQPISGVGFCWLDASGSARTAAGETSIVTALATINGAQRSWSRVFKRGGQT